MDHGTTTGWSGSFSGAEAGEASERPLAARRVRVLGPGAPVGAQLPGVLARRAVLSVRLVRAAFEHVAQYLLAVYLQWTRRLCGRPIAHYFSDVQAHLVAGWCSSRRHRLAGRGPGPVFHVRGSRVVVSRRWSTAQAAGPHSLRPRCSRSWAEAASGAFATTFSLSRLTSRAGALAEKLWTL